MTTESRKPYNLNLIDLLRGVAILLVFGYHLHLAQVDSYVPHEQGILRPEKATPAQLYATFSPLNYGSIGVQLFLVISGFLIHYLFLVREQASVSWRNFYLRRFWRIYPPYLLILLFFVFQTRESASYYLFDSQGRFSLLTHVLMVHNLFGDNGIIFGINPSFWSIALEVQLYLLYPLFLFFRRKLGIRRLSIVLLVVHLLATSGILYAKGGFPDKLSENTFVLHYWIIWGLGALVAEGYYQRKPVFGASRATLLALILLFYCSQYFILGYTYFYAIESAFIFALVIDRYIYTFEPLASGSKWKPLWQLLIRIGMCSYSMYLIHQPLVAPLLRYFKVEMLPFWLRPYSMILVFAVIFCLSYSLYLFVEKTSIDFGKRMIRKLEA